MHTPEEAKLLWCPMYRHVAIPREIGCNGGGGGGGSHYLPDRCQADQCAMWRWDYSMQNPIGPAGCGPVLPQVRVQGDTGYCGMGGKP